ncbi:MAG: type II toxin-antitoxin system Phd/YefM family antitoxin [Verrucomicrobiia bacterium]
MKTADATTVVRQFGRYLGMIEAGQSIRITKHGRPVARLVPDPGFMSGKEFAQVFASYRADAVDKATAKEIAKNIAQLNAEVDDALAH